MFAAKALKRSGDVLRLHLRAAAHRSFSSAAAPCSDSKQQPPPLDQMQARELFSVFYARHNNKEDFHSSVDFSIHSYRRERAAFFSTMTPRERQKIMLQLRSSKVWVASPNEELDKTSFMISSWIRKLWVPTLAVLTVILGWQYPVSLAVNLLLLVWSTKPTPASIHIWLEERRMEAAIQKQGLDRFKHQLNFSLVKHIQVEDHLLFCLARVSGLTESIVLLGFLGNWWVLHSSMVFLKY